MAGGFLVRLWDRNGLDARAEQLTLTPLWYGASAIGGPEAAEIAVTGLPDALWQIVDWLQYRVEIRNPSGALVWWGYVEMATVGMGPMQIGRTLEEVANKVQVAYTYETPSGAQERGTTDWAQDNASVAQFGRFEARVSLADTEPDAADSRRDTELTQKAWPQPVSEFGDNRGGLLTCRGWWATLEREFYADARGIEEHPTYADIEHVIGWVLTSTDIGFHEDRVDDIQARLATIRPQNALRVVGSPANSGLYIVQSGPDKDVAAQTYAASTISFEEQDDIRDSALGLGWARLGYMIHSNSAQGGNNGTFWVTKEGSDALEVTPATITNQSAGASFTLKQGHGLTVEDGDGPNGGAFWLEKAGASVSLYHGSYKVAQGFRLESAQGWTVREIQVRAMKVGAPADNLRARIYSASGGNPNAVLGEWTVAAANVGTEMGWLTFDLGSGLALAAGTDYFLCIDRTGAASHVNFFVTGLESGATYERGELRVVDGSTGLWGPRDPDAHMPFRLTGRTETTTQLREILDAGQWVNAVVVRAASGVDTGMFKDGEQTLATEVQRLLEMGMDGGGRLLARVSADRSVIVESAPASGLHNWRMDAAGKLRTTAGQRADEGILPVGEWVTVDGAPAGLRDLATIFVERAEYEIENARLTLTPGKV